MTRNVKRFCLPVLALALLAMALFASSSPIEVAWAQDGKALYGKKCANCHALDGSGNTAKGKEYKLKDIRLPEVQKASDQQLFDLYHKGKGKMTGLGKTLSKEELQALVAYTRELAKKK
jgi:mono/diheme cytochrome c family protein